MRLSQSFILTLVVCLGHGCALKVDYDSSLTESESINAVPNAPSELTATATSTNAISLTWKDNSRRETGYQVERASSVTGPFVVLESTLRANTVTYRDTGLALSEAYFYRVRAIGWIGVSNPSNVASAVLDGGGTGGSSGGGSSGGGSAGGGSAGGGSAGGGSAGGGSAGGGSAGGGSAGGGSAGGGSAGGGSSGGGSAGGGSQMPPLSAFAQWTRNSKYPVFAGTYFAGDPHVWEEAPGQYRMLFTDDGNGRQAIAMATSADLVNWTLIKDSQFPNGIVLQGAGPGKQDTNLETAFYRKAKNGKHQIFYIGYTDENTYHSAIYKAESSTISGPYVRETNPVLTWTTNLDAWAMTSPSIVEHEGKSSMVYVGWDTFPDGPWHVVGAISSDDGQTWNKQGDLGFDKVFGVEAHTEKGPDGLFYRVGVIDDGKGKDAIGLGRASHPFGPFEQLPAPILTMTGPGEGDSIMSPGLVFVHSKRTAYIHYAAVDTGGWPWVLSLATCPY